MTVIQPNSIAGITSITALTDTINLYKSDGTAAGLNLNGVNLSNTSGVSTFSSLVVTNINSSGVGTFTNGPVLIGSGTSTGTASQRLQVTGGGYFSSSVGIGTTIAQRALQVHVPKDGGNNSSISRFSNEDRQWDIAIKGGNLVLGENVGGQDYLRVDTSGNLLINRTSATGTASQPLQVSGGAYVSGNVGVGTTNPQYPLHVVSNSNGYVSNTFTNSSNGTSAVNRIQIGNDSSDGSGQIVVYGSQHSTLANILDINNASNAAMRFLTNNTERARIDSSGRLGIGTISPDYPLTVRDTLGDAQISLKNSSGTTKAYLGTNGAFGSASTDDLRIRSEGSNIIFGFNGTERARIDSSGNVSIGTTNQTVSKLFVSGGSLSVSSSDANFGAGGNRAFFDVDGSNVRIGATGGGTAWTRGIIFYVSNNITTSNTAGAFTSASDFQFNSGYGSVATAYGCRAWVNFSGATPTIRSSGNVSSVTRNSSGNYTINFTNAMPDTNYSTAFGGGSNTGSQSYYPMEQHDSPLRTTSAVKIYTLNQSGTPIDAGVICVHIFR